MSEKSKAAAGGYRPEQQQIPARVFTTAGWLSGDIRAPKRHVWLDHINGCGPWLKMTGVALPGQAAPVSFFALSRTAAVLIEPTEPHSALSTQRIPGDRAVHHVDCLLDVGIASGTLELSPQIRVSDHLARKTDFMALHDCSLRLFGRFGEATLELTMPLAFVNCGRIVGVTELEVD